MSLGGVNTAAKIMSLMKMDMANTIIEDIAKEDKDLAIEIQDNMFLFDTLANIDNRAVQIILQKTQNDQLIIALKGSNKFIQDKFLNNVSQRARKRMLDDMDFLGELTASDIELAQKKITRTARKLAENGDIILEINRNEFV
jgi:flagellar motor switch protein FliG